MWLQEELKCIDRRARHIAVPQETGVESELVQLADVLARKVWFTDAGVYILRDETGQVMYVGSSHQPLRCRLQSAIYAGKSWTTADYRAWTVSMQRWADGPDYRQHERALIAEVNPVFNIMGRPRKDQGTCSCVGMCPECGKQRRSRRREELDEEAVET